MKMSTLASEAGEYNKHKHLDQYCVTVLSVQSRIRAMTMSSRLRRDSVAKRYEQDTDEESDEDGKFPGQEEHAVHITATVTQGFGNHFQYSNPIWSETIHGSVRRRRN